MTLVHSGQGPHTHRATDEAAVDWCRPVSEEEMQYIEAEARLCRDADRLGLSRRAMDVSPATIAALAHTAGELIAEVAVLRAELVGLNTIPPGRVRNRIDAGLGLRERLKASGQHFEAQKVFDLISSLRASNNLNGVLQRALERALKATTASSVGIAAGDEPKSPTQSEEADHG